jgi:hypothetical protein
MQISIAHGSSQLQADFWRHRTATPRLLHQLPTPLPIWLGCKCFEIFWSEPTGVGVE